MGPQRRLPPVWVRQSASTTGNPASSLGLPLTPLAGSLLIVGADSWLATNTGGGPTIYASGGGCPAAWPTIGRSNGPVAGSQDSIYVFLGTVEQTPSATVTVNNLSGQSCVGAFELANFGQIERGPSFIYNREVGHLAVAAHAASGVLALPELADEAGGIVVAVFSTRGGGSLPSGFTTLINVTSAGSPGVQLTMGYKIRKGAERHNLVFGSSSDQCDAVGAVIRPLNWPY